MKDNGKSIDDKSMKRQWIGRDTFFIEGTEYLAYPNLDELLIDAGIQVIKNPMGTKEKQIDRFDNFA